MLKSKTLIILVALGCLFAGFQTYASSFIVKNDNAHLYYGCPFDIDVYIDTQGEEIMGASIDILLQSGLLLEGYAFGGMFNLGYPYLHNTGSNTYKIFSYKFPGVLSGVQKFVTLRFVQNDNVPGNKIFFIADEKNYSSNDSWTNIFYLGGKNSLQSIQNTDMVFSEGNCGPLNILSGDVTKMSQADLLHNASALIDQFKEDQNVSFWKTYSLYIKITGLILLILIILIVCFYCGRRKK